MTHQERIHIEQETESARLRAARDVTRNHAQAGYGEHCGIYVVVKDAAERVSVARDLSIGEARESAAATRVCDSVLPGTVVRARHDSVCFRKGCVR